MNEFSALNRNAINEKLSDNKFDILIIGGGITGAGIALDAAARGLKIALIEQNDFASGTSSKSTKLIHGGLRYLKQFDVKLVKEVGSERAIVHKLAPHLVLPEKMLLPLIKDGTYGKVMSSIGLKVYDILAGVKGDDRRRMLNKKKAMAIEPLLPENILEGAGYYAEYRTDDARLTIEVLKTALNYDTTALNYTKAIDFVYEEGKVRGAKVKDSISNKEYEIKANYVINATGPWVDELRTINKSKEGKRLHLTKGVHLTFAHEKLPIKNAVYFDIPDGRMMFAIPRGKTTYIGTTDTNYTEDKNDVKVTKEDVKYLVDAVNNMFPTVDLQVQDLQSCWAGLRPLIHEEGKSESELSRKDEIFVSPTELISIAGGKLTGYRKMAQRIVYLISKMNQKGKGKLFSNSKTRKIVLSGGKFNGKNDVISYIKTIEERIIPFGFNHVDAAYLVHNYGKQANIILDYFDNLVENDNDWRLMLAELWFGVKYEMVQTPLDFLERRTGNMNFDINRVLKYKSRVLDEFKTVFDWNDKEFMYFKNQTNLIIKGLKP